MGAVGFTSGDPNKVDVAGDTMTGTLTIAAPNDLIVGDDGTFLGDLGVTGLITGNTASIGTISGANNTTIHRIYGIGAPGVSDQITVQYGQNIYSSLAAATAAIGTGVFIPNFTTAGAALLGWVAATRVATNLSDPTQASFTHAGRFSAP